MEDGEKYNDTMTKQKIRLEGLVGMYSGTADVSKKMKQSNSGSKLPEAVLYPFQNSPEQISQFTLDKASYSNCTQHLLSCMRKFTSSREIVRKLLREKAYPMH
ncbi:uncharacterized protein J5F26_000426 [Ciconia maguari]